MSITELDKLFAQPNEHLAQDVSAELDSVMRSFALSEQELFFKWEAYSIKLGSENTNLDFKTLRDFKKDLQDSLERDARGKLLAQSGPKKHAPSSTPRSTTTGDVYAALDGLVGGTPAPRTAIKRRSQYETPSGKASKTAADSSPHGANGVLSIGKVQASFDERGNAGQIIESLNAQLIPDELPPFDGSEARIKVKSSTDISKFGYKTMAMKLSEASEILDDRIDEFSALIKQHHGLSESAFGNPAARSTSDIVAVGRIATDSEGGLNAASLVLETSRRMGAGLRIPVKLENQAFDFFPGKIVALRGINAAGESFRVAEQLSMPLLPLQVSKPEDVDTINARTASSGERPLTVQVASGPYTPDTDLSFAALHALVDRAIATRVDALILTGPFLDSEHPLIASGDFALPPSYPVSADAQTLSDVFKHHVSTPLHRLASASPTTTIILVPSVRDAASPHACFPQDRLARRELGLPKQALCVTNPVTLCLNEVVVGISSQDVLYEMQKQGVSHGHTGIDNDRLARLTGDVIAQQHFFPVFPPLAPGALPRPTAFPVTHEDGVDGEEEEAESGVGARQRSATGASLDVSYLKLGEWLGLRPDLLVLPSVLPPFAKVVQNVVAVNPGALSKKKAAGTFVEMRVLPRRMSEEERAAEYVHHNLFERARVDVVRI